MRSSDFCPSRWRTLLDFNGLRSFDQLWSLELAWLEHPNREGRGWSGVGKVELRGHDGALRSLYVKRQENYGKRTVMHPLRPASTLAREIRRTLQLRACRIGTPEPVYFGERLVAGKRRAILITEELRDFGSLEALSAAWCLKEQPGPGERRAAIDAVAGALRELHRHRLQHGAMYPKHVFLAFRGPTAEARLIDLEKVKWRPLRLLVTLRDLDSLNRHADGWSRTNRMRFLLRYLCLDRMSPRARRLWKALTLKHTKKTRRRR